uniref:Z-binding domain-containing protein n=1 Tax=Sinocyclocheilus anshuiensis TaxID=1608454 RepID=A0A671LVH7_9TELE
MPADTEMEREICDFLRRNGKSTALIIAKEIGLDKSTVNKHLYNLERSNQVFKTDEQPPVWGLMEKKNEIKPELKSQTTRDTSEEKDVEDLLKRSGGLKAHQIATDLGQPKQTINKQLYSMEEKGKVQKCSKSKVWTLNEEWSHDSFSQESDHGLDSVSGLRGDIQISFGYKYAARCHRHANKTECRSP